MCPKVRNNMKQINSLMLMARVWNSCVSYAKPISNLPRRAFATDANSSHPGRGVPRSLLKKDTLLLNICTYFRSKCVLGYSDITHDTPRTKKRDITPLWLIEHKPLNESSYFYCIGSVSQVWRKWKEAEINNCTYETALRKIRMYLLKSVIQFTDFSIYNIEKILYYINT